VIAKAILPFEFNFGLQSSPGISAAAQGHPHCSAGTLPPGEADGGGHPIIVDMELVENFPRRLAAAQQPLDPRISRLIDEHFWDLI